MLSQATAASVARHYDEPPQREAPGKQTWITRGANFVVALSRVKAGAVLRRPSQADEYMVLLADIAADIRVDGQSVSAQRETLTIVPPGDSSVTAQGDGIVVCVFSSDTADLCAAAGNAGVYAQGAPEVAKTVAWPDPPQGFVLRNYVLADHIKPDSNMRIFRSTKLMLNIMTPRMVARDVHKLSPHQHTDFEQGSLALRGDWVHYLRHPWTADLDDWKDDQHITIGSPSLTVVPPKVIHTSRNTNDGGAWLVDVFAPPRLDFSSKPGMVCNAADYPMPATS